MGTERIEERCGVVLADALVAAGVPPEEPLVVAFSGGPDSAALLVLLAALRPGGVEAIHVDHGLRPASGAEAREALALAAGLGLPCRIVRVRPEGRGGPEARARRARYQALAEAAAGRPVLTAHTADDQAETVLLRLARGAGSRGLAGVRPVARIAGARVLRPLLAVRRADLATLLRARGVAPVIDPSNADPAFARNRVRATVLPALEAALPGAVRRLARAAATLAEDERVLDRRARRALARLARDGGADAAGILSLPSALGNRALRALVERSDRAGPSLAELDRLRGLLRGEGDLHLRGGVRARVRAGILVVERAPTGRAARAGEARAAVLLVPGAPALFGGYHLEVDRGPASGTGGDPGVLELPAAGTAPPFRVRPARPGERVRTPSGGRAVRELLRAAGVPAGARAEAPVLEAGGEAVWVVGVRPLVPLPAAGTDAWILRARRRH